MANKMEKILPKMPQVGVLWRPSFRVFEVTQETESLKNPPSKSVAVLAIKSLFQIPCLKSSIGEVLALVEPPVGEEPIS
jgi:hypothetical protein